MTPAERYAARGLCVLPLRGKMPVTPHGVHDATALTAIVQSWWRETPNANVGIAIGVGALVDVRVVDVDAHHGGDRTLAELEARHGALPVTPRQRTGQGGAHVLLGWPEGPTPRTKLARGLELLGRGRYFVAAPSVHPLTRRPYVWTTDLDTPIADAPAWLVELASPRAVRRGAAERPRGGGYARAALISAIGRVERAADGERNVTLNREAYAIARFVGAGDLDAQLVADAMIDAGRAAGLPTREAERTVESALSARLRDRDRGAA